MDDDDFDAPPCTRYTSVPILTILAFLIPILIMNGKTERTEVTIMTYMPYTYCSQGELLKPEFLLYPRTNENENCLDEPVDDVYCHDACVQDPDCRFAQMTYNRRFCPGACKLFKSCSSTTVIPLRSPDVGGNNPALGGETDYQDSPPTKLYQSFEKTTKTTEITKV